VIVAVLVLLLMLLVMTTNDVTSPWLMLLMAYLVHNIPG